MTPLPIMGPHTPRSCVKLVYLGVLISKCAFSKENLNKSKEKKEEKMMITRDSGLNLFSCLSVGSCCNLGHFRSSEPSALG